MKYRRRSTLALSLFLLFQASSAISRDNDDDELDLYYGDLSFVSIATGSQLWLRRAPAVATVITAQEIQLMGATDIDQVLETVPGVHVSATADGYSPIYIFRGIVNPIINPQVLMLQNGVPMTVSFAGDRGRYGSTIPVDNVARIEVLRGPGSALYGADAYAGVINVITKSASDIQGTQITTRVGSFHSREGSILHGGKLGDADVAAYLRVGSTNGFRSTIAADAATRFDRAFGTQSSLAPGSVNLGHDDVDGSIDLAYDRWRLRAGYKLREHMGTGAGISFALDPAGENRSERITTELSWSDPRIAGNWGGGFTASYLNYREKGIYQLFPPGIVFPSITVGNSVLARILGVPLGTVVPGAFPNGVIGFPERYERQQRLSAFATYSGVEHHSFRFGFGHDNLDLYRSVTRKNYFLDASGVPVPTGPVIDYSDIQPHIVPHRRQLDYLYAQDEWSFAQDWSLTAGVRYDHYSDFGSTTNPRLALVWDAALDLTAKLLYGRAFRAPSFTDQYGTNPTGSGNPGIRPETINTLEGALAWQLRPDLQTNLSVFHYQRRDIIRTIPNPPPAPGAVFTNAGSQHGNGIEVETVWDAGRNLRVSGNYAYQKSIDEMTNADVGYAPHHHLYGRTDWRFAGPWVASLQINRIAERLRPVGDTRPKLPDYTSVDLTVRTQRNRGQWDFVGSIRNLFQAKIIEPSVAPGSAIPNDLPMAPRSFWLGANYSL